MDDIESDFSVFHRVDDIEELDGPRFFKFCTRLPAYQGVLQARINKEIADEENNPQNAPELTKEQTTMNQNFKAYPEEGFPSVFG